MSNDDKKPKPTPPKPPPPPPPKKSPIRELQENHVGTDYSKRGSKKE